MPVSAQDPLHKTGLAHMMEHMAFKGTPDIGTTDYAEEKVALQKVEETYAAYETERIKRVGQDPQKLKQLQEACRPPSRMPTNTSSRTNLARSSKATAELA